MNLFSRFRIIPFVLMMGATMVGCSKTPTTTQKPDATDSPVATKTPDANPSPAPSDQRPASALNALTPGEFQKGAVEIDAMPPSTIRIATYNASLYGKKSGEIADRLSDGEDTQAEKVATVIQTARPDVLLINEIDYDADAKTARLLCDGFLAKPQGDLEAMEYPYVYSVSSNTGVDSGLDLSANGKTGEPTDAWGFGVYPGQYSMAVLSRFPIDEKSIRSFQKFLWKDLPGALRPMTPDKDDSKPGKSYYDDEIWQQLRLSSKNHIDVPININGFTLHVLASHPTPPVFDGPEDRNGCRNHDEIKFWSEYLSDGEALIDDNGTAGGLAKPASFVIMGDLNADSVDGDGKREAIQALLGHPRVRDPSPKSSGAVAASEGKKSAARQKGDPGLDTAKFGGGNYRVDYVLPSRTMPLKASGVVWPDPDADDYTMISASDHRMVWVDVEVPK